MMSRCRTYTDDLNYFTLNDGLRFYLSICNWHIRPPPPIITKLRKVKNRPIFGTTTQRFFFNTVHNLINFSIVFTNKNRGDPLSPPPPPPIITKVYLPLIITKVNQFISDNFCALSRIRGPIVELLLDVL